MVSYPSDFLVSSLCFSKFNSYRYTASRALGDALAHRVGVSSVPEISTHELSATDRFLILASDGIWEFITNEEAGTYHVLTTVHFIHSSPLYASQLNYFYLLLPLNQPR